MSLFVNTNVSALNAQRQLINSGNGLSQAFQRLSSGFRINSAADDAAGLQISNRLTGQINGLNQGISNANDAISVAQVAEGALDEVTTALQRMRVLAVQAENGINSPADRAALQKEVLALQKEIDRISTTTEFGGQKLLNGSYNSSFLVGANAGEKIDIDLAQFGAMDTADLWVSEVNLRAAKSQSDGERAYIGSEYDALGEPIKYEAFNNSLHHESGPDAVYGPPNSIVSGLAVKIDDGSWIEIPSYTTTTGSKRDFVDALNAAVGRPLLRYVNGVGSVMVDEDVTLQFALTGLSATSADASNRQQDYQNLTGLSDYHLGILPYGNTDFNTSLIDRAIEKVDTSRAYLGAQQNRFQSTIRNLSNVSENISAARSRIRDTDFAKETAELTRQQILQQAGTTILSQANQRPQAALNLLG